MEKGRINHRVISINHFSTKVDDEAVLVNKLNAVSFKSQSQKFNGSCFYCKRPGHKISEFKRSNTFHCERRVHWDDRNKHNGKESYRSDRKDGFKKSQSFMIDAEWDEPEEEQVNSFEVACNGLKVNTLQRVSINIELCGFNKKVNMLIDSGSSGSFINPAKLPLEMPNYLETLKRNPEQMANSSNVNINTNSWYNNHRFIFADVAEDGILGIDFLMKFDAVLDYNHRRVTIKQDQNDVHLNYINKNENKNEPKGNKVLATVKRIVKPKTEFVLKCKANPELIGREMIKVDENGELFLIGINASEKEVELESGSEFGSLEDVEIMNTKVNLEDKLDLLDIGLTDLTKHEIKTGDTKPIKQRAYRLPQAAQDEVSKQIKNMLSKNVIRESKSHALPTFQRLMDD
ncbi:unnamed protein product [Brachionus calyciflorus]|uniref:Peptidase A2 domain-containing protein n=1 Tax=Brachionus calyciflorus TaxID=104777 RepID=A0A814IR61_9BILA|nr:unnamed protein product [Brachionus calyciflorus]